LHYGGIAIRLPQRRVLHRHSGARGSANPESRVDQLGSGFIAGRLPRMTVRVSQAAPTPIAMKSIGELDVRDDQGRRGPPDVGGVEYSEIAAVFAAAPDRGQQPAVPRRQSSPRATNTRLGDGSPGGQQILAGAIPCHRQATTTDSAPNRQSGWRRSTKPWVRGGQRGGRRCAGNGR